MRIRISHQATFAYAPASRSTIVNLRLTPRSFDSQYVLRWRVGVDLDCALRHSQDSLGNIVQTFSHHKPVERFTVSADGEVETSDAVGVVRGSEEPLPPEMFLRASAKATANANIRAFLDEALAGASDELDLLHRLMEALHENIAFDPDAADARGGAAETLSLKRGSGGDIAHLFVAAAHAHGVPARVVTGFVAPEDGEAEGRLEVWTEALAPKLGWVAFDCVRNLCANDRYVRVGVGFDHAGAQPIRASHSGGGVETIETVSRIQPVTGLGQMQRMS
jgi:transglutaminase-like putative cysteine protease